MSDRHFEYAEMHTRVVFPLGIAKTIEFKLTDRLVAVMQRATGDAQDVRYIGTNTLLLSLMSESSGVAANVLTNLKIDRDKLRLEAQKLVQGDQIPRLCPRTVQVIENAKDEALGMRHDHLGTEHLLLGLLHDEESVAGQVLNFSGLTLDAAREEVLRLLGSGYT